MSTHPIVFNQRKIKKNYRSVTGYFPSMTNNRSVAFESKLEKSLFLSLEFDNDVISYQEQPQIEVYFNGKNQIYSADCYIKRSTNSAQKDSIVEVKYTSELEKEKEYFEEKFNAVKITTAEINLDFEIYTEINYSEIYLDNLDFLYRYKLNPIDDKYENKILKTLQEYKSISAYDLTQSITTKLQDYALVSNTIWSLVAQEKIKTDLQSEKLTMNSIVELL